jgi:hypothetical protein
MSKYSERTQDITELQAVREHLRHARPSAAEEGCHGAAS